MLWLQVATTNNDSAVIAGYFLKAVSNYGEIILLPNINIGIAVMLTASVTHRVP